MLRVRSHTISVDSDMQIMNIQISLKFHAVCATSMQNYNDLGLKGIWGIIGNVHSACNGVCGMAKLPQNQ